LRLIWFIYKRISAGVKGRLRRVSRVPFLDPIAAVFVSIAITAWALTLIGTVRHVLALYGMQPPDFERK
jgi:hypothetical protein